MTDHACQELGPYTRTRVRRSECYADTYHGHAKESGRPAQTCRLDLRRVKALGIWDSRYPKGCPFHARTSLPGYGHLEKMRRCCSGPPVENSKLPSRRRNPKSRGPIGAAEQATCRPARSPSCVSRPNGLLTCIVRDGIGCARLATQSHENRVLSLGYLTH